MERAPAQDAAGVALARSALFVGNSQTATHDLPQLIEAFARARGDAVFEAHRSTLGGETLEGHVRRKDRSAPLALLGDREWTWVILQENGRLAAAVRPSPLEPFSLRPARQLVEAARDSGAQVLAYMTWPAKSVPGAIRGIRANHRRLAEELNVQVVPVGEAFALAEQPGWSGLPSLYAIDGVHASEAGAYLAATMLYSSLFERSPVGLPPALGLPATLCADLQKLSSEAFQAFAD